MNNTRDEGKVGYKRPPKHTRFQKGQSGNPRGRPKGASNFKADLLATLHAPVPVTEEGRRRTISTQKASLLRLREKALKGDVKALDRLIALAQHYNGEDLSHETTAPLADADQAIIDSFLTRQIDVAAEESIAEISQKTSKRAVIPDDDESAAEKGENNE